jgi:actin-binding protein anillin
MLLLFTDNTLYFWKYPEDEQKRRPPIEAESIPMHNCFTENVTLAPRDICARMNTFMVESRRPTQNGDKEALNMHVVRITITQTPDISFF